MMKDFERNRTLMAKRNGNSCTLWLSTGAYIKEKSFAYKVLLEILISVVFINGVAITRPVNGPLVILEVSQKNETHFRYQNLLFINIF